MHFTIAAAIASFALASSHDPAPELVRALDERLAAIDAHDGIDGAEAYSLMQIYFGAFLAGCGFPEQPTLSNGMWRAPIRVGVAGQPLPDLLTVGARSGEVHFPGCPRFASITSLRAGVLQSLAKPRSGVPCWLRPAG